MDTGIVADQDDPKAPWRDEPDLGRAVVIAERQLEAEARTSQDGSTMYLTNTADTEVEVEVEVERIVAPAPTREAVEPERMAS